MNIFFEVIIIVFLFAIYFFTHTLLASKKVKLYFRSKLHNRMAFYRITYNVLALTGFMLIWEYSPSPDIFLYDLPAPYDLIIVFLQILSLAGILWAGSFINISEFIGYSQIKRYFAGTYNENELDEKQEFRIIGAYKFSRHPIYFFVILFLGLRPTMDLFYATAFVCIVVYFYLGSFYEEKKLLEEFGEDYRQYQKIVPRIIPCKLFNKDLEKLIGD